MSTPTPPTPPEPPVDVTPYVPPVGATPNITPFTYRDGLTYLQRLQGLTKYINRIIVPYVNTLNETWIESIDAISVAVEEAAASIAESVEDADAAQAAAEAAMAAAIAAQEAAELAAENAANANDAAMTAIWNNVASAFRQALNSYYATQADLDALEATVAQIVIDTTDLVTQTQFDELAAIVGTKAPQSEVDTLNNLVNNGRLSANSLETQFEANRDNAIAVSRRGRYDVDTFEYLRAGAAAATTQDTRVVVLGSSTAFGGNTLYRLEGQGVIQRLAAAAGAPVLQTLSDVVANVNPNGMQWFQGALSGSNSTNFYDSTIRPKVNFVKPHYILNFVGSNDYMNQLPLATYKTNIGNAFTDMETNNPGAIIVVISQQGRIDDLTRPITWAQYRQANKEVAALNPNRIYIDVFDGFEALGTDTNNRWGLISSDKIHMQGTGHSFLFDVLSSHMGLPDPRLVAPYIDVRPFAFPPGATYNVNTVLAGITVEAANYPRLVRFEGVGYFTPSSGNTTSELITRRKNADGVTIDETRTFRMGEATAKSRPIQGTFILEQYAKATFEVYLGVGTGTVVVTDNRNTFLVAHLLLQPI